MFGWFKKTPAEPDPPSGGPPIPLDELRELFQYLGRPNPPPCDHTHRETTAFLQSRGVPVEPTLAWLRANGGFCDCEVIFNVTNDWGEVVGWEPQEDE